MQDVLSQKVSEIQTKLNSLIPYVSDSDAFNQYIQDRVNVENTARGIQIDLVQSKVSTNSTIDDLYKTIGTRTATDIDHVLASIPATSLSSVISNSLNVINYDETTMNIDSDTKIKDLNNAITTISGLSSLDQNTQKFILNQLNNAITSTQKSNSRNTSFYEVLKAYLSTKNK